MSNLSYLEKLLDGVDVEWKSFGEIAKIQRGASPRPIAKFITDDEDGVPWIKIGDTESGSKYVEQTAQKITKEGATKSRVLKKGDFIIAFLHFPKTADRQRKLRFFTLRFSMFTKTEMCVWER